MIGSLAGCREKPSPPEAKDAVLEPLEGESVEPQDAPDPTPAGRKTCGRKSSAQEVRLRSARASGREEEGAREVPYAVEIGEAVESGERLVVPFLRTGPTNRAVLLIVDGKGAALELELGEVHGDVEPPRLTDGGGRLFGAVVDNAARGRNLRLFTVENLDAKAEVVWGPEVPVNPGEELGLTFSIERKTGHGLVIFEDVRDGKSRLFRTAIPFAAPGVPGAREGFKKARPPESLGLSLPARGTLSDELGHPVLAHAIEGYWLALLRYEKTKVAAEGADAAGAGLLEEPSTLPMLVRLDLQGKPRGEPRALVERSFHCGSLTFAPSAETEALIATTSLDSGEGNRVSFLRVAEDGVVHSFVATHPELTTSGPLLFVKGGALALVGGGDDPLIVLPTKAGAPEPFRELGFGSSEPLVGSGTALWGLAPSGLDASLARYDCAF